MAWIESHQDLLTSPKTLTVSAQLRWNVDETIGRLHRFWWWCVDHAEDGDLRRYNDAVLARAIGLEAAQGKGFVHAMCTAGGRGRSGFLDRRPYFRVHDWWEYIGPYLQAKYKRTPQKWERVRNMYMNGDVTGSTTVTQPDTNQPLPTNQPTNQPTS